MEETIRVVVVIDHRDLRDHLVILLSGYEGIHVVGAADNGNRAIEMCSKLRPDIVLMDAQMPTMDGFTATEIIRRRSPDIHVVMLTNGYLGEAQHATHAGASAFLLKPVSTQRVVNTLREVYKHYRAQNTDS